MAQGPSLGLLMVRAGSRPNRKAGPQRDKLFVWLVNSVWPAIKATALLLGGTRAGALNSSAA